jgi:hypothetical protein
MATERTSAGSGGNIPLSAAQAEEDIVARAATADGLITARVNGAPFVASKAYAFETLWWMDGRRYLNIRHGETQRGNSLSLSIPVKDGDSHVDDGRYVFGLPEASGMPVPAMSYGEPAPAPPGFIGWVSFSADSGWIDLKFNTDRTRVDATFEFEAAGEEHGDRIIRKGSFSIPNVDLPDSTKLTQ